MTEEPPDRNLGGGSIRQAYLLEALARRVPTDLLLAGSLADAETRAVLVQSIEVPAPPRWDPPNRTVRRFLDLWLALVEREPPDAFYLRRARRVLAPALRQTDDYDLVIVNHHGLMPLLPARRRARWVAHLHNVASDRARQATATAAGRRQRWLFEREAHKAERLERWAVGAYDAVLVCSDADADALTGPDRSRATGPVIVASNGVDLSRVVPTPLPAEPRLAVIASLNYLPNVDGIQWFVREVLPLVRTVVPDTRLDIVGRNPVAAVRALTEVSGIELHADVDDIVPYYAAARVAIVPLRVGTGTRLKAPEALAAGRPLVGTTIGLAGFDLVDGTHACIADTPTEMADAIVGLLRSDDRAKAMAAAGRALVEQRYGWNTIAASATEQLLALIDHEPRT